MIFLPQSSAGQATEGREQYVVLKAVVVMRQGPLVLLLSGWPLSLRQAAEQSHCPVDVHDAFRSISLDALFLPLAGLQLAFS